MSSLTARTDKRTNERTNKWTDSLMGATRIVVVRFLVYNTLHTKIHRIKSGINELMNRMLVRLFVQRSLDLTQIRFPSRSIACVFLGSAACVDSNRETTANHSLFVMSHILSYFKYLVIERHFRTFNQTKTRRNQHHFQDRFMKFLKNVCACVIKRYKFYPKKLNKFLIYHTFASSPF